MPTSDPRVIEAGCGEIISLKPKSVLDIGVGFGKWGALAREYTDIWQGRFYKDEWETYITGIEIHERYKNPMWSIYNEVHIGNAQEVIQRLEARERRYDLAIMMDVLEHFLKIDGQELIANTLEVASNFMVSWCNSAQKDVRDNKYEDHISCWSVKDFKEMGFLKKVIKNEQHFLGDWGIVLLGKDT